MTRNIWNADEQPVEDVPLPEYLDPKDLEGEDPMTYPVSVPLTNDEIAQIDAKIVQMEGETELTETAAVVLDNLKKARAALGPTG